MSQNMKSLYKLSFKKQRSQFIIVMLVLAGLLTAATSAVQYWYAHEELRKSAHDHAKSRLELKSMEIQAAMTSVESAINNSVWMVEKRIYQPDSIYSILQRLVAQNVQIVGATVSFKADFYPQFGRWCELYVSQRRDGSFEQKQIGGPLHDYLQSDWFREGIKANACNWSEPYYDNIGAKMLVCTYTMPIRNAKGRIVGLLDADVSLEWLAHFANSQTTYKSSYNVILSKGGKLLVHPDKHILLRSTMRDQDISQKDRAFDQISRQMFRGMSGHSEVITMKGEKKHVFFTPVRGNTGWSIAMVFNDDEIYATLQQATFRMSAILLAGLLLLGYIIWRSIRNMRRLEDTRRQKAAFERELRVASRIQMALLPKSFPPYPERNDVDLHATLVPAKEVGGDLYDFYIRDEKMFFCIGDVSGKGIPASLVMAITRTLFRNVSARESKPHSIVSAMNNTLAEDNQNNFFVTLFVGVLDLPTGVLSYCNAGHEPPIIINETATPLKVDSNLPIGAISQWHYTMQEITITPHTTIFLYTDGVTEAKDAAHNQFGRQRMLRELTSSAKPKTIVDNMTAAIHSFVGGARQSDDITMMAVCYNRQERAVRLNRSLTLTNDVSNIPELTKFVNEVCREVDFNNSKTKQVRLAMEEAVVNVIDYAYPHGTTEKIYIEAVANDERLKFTITDSGKPFDITAYPDVDLNIPAEERPIGGLGIHIVRQMMDSINYNRIDGKNVLTLRKKL